MLQSEGLRRSIGLAHAKDRLRQKMGRHQDRRRPCHAATGIIKVGQNVQVEALVDLPELRPDEVSVQLYSGPLNAQGTFDNALPLGMTYAKEMAPNRHVFVGKIDCRTSGRHGFAVRVLPGNKDLATPFEPGLIIWN